MCGGDDHYNHRKKGNKIDGSDHEDDREFGV